MKMRRTLAAMMSGILAMSPAGVIFADEAAQTPVTYGDMISFSLTQDGETLSADITAVYNESGKLPHPKQIPDMTALFLYQLLSQHQ